MLKNQEEYKYLPEFYQTAKLNKGNILLLNVEIKHEIINILCVEQKNYLITITTGVGLADRPIYKENIYQVAINNTEFEQIERLLKKK
jgi:hypothetical protein